MQYVLIFENRGIEVGATLHHPHGQIYGYPFLPPVPKLELAADGRLGGCAPCTLLRSELEDGRRIVYENEAVVAYIPYAARWPYEVHVVTRRHCASLLDCNPDELCQLAESLQTVTRGYDALFDRRSHTSWSSTKHLRTDTRTATCMSSSIPRCAQRTSSSTSQAPSRAGHLHRRHAARGVLPRSTRGDCPWPVSAPAHSLPVA